MELGSLTTAHVADACLRAAVPPRCAPPGLRPLDPGAAIAGRVLPVRHAGSIDIFLEALDRAEPGDVLVIDNGGRLDEACVGDLVTLEAKRAGLAGIVIWGLHRDTAEIHAIGLPLFSLGATPTGPQRLDPRAGDALDAATIGSWTVDRRDIVLGDDDGVLFVPADRAGEIARLAESIRDTERRQAQRMAAGETLRTQLHFDAYLAQRESTPSYPLRDHLRAIGGAAEV